MLLDKQGIFSEEQAVLSTCYSTNYVYFGQGDVSYVPLIVQVVEDYVSATAVTVEVETSATSNFSSSTSLVSSTMAGTKLKVGVRFPIPFLPKGNLGYMRLKFTVVGSPTAGKITAATVNSSLPSWHD